MAPTDSGWRPRHRRRAPAGGVQRLVTAAAAAVAAAVAASLVATAGPVAAAAAAGVDAAAAATGGGGGGAAPPRGVALVHMHDGAPFFLRLGGLTLANKRRYAARHGYEMVAHVPEGTDGLFLPVRSVDGCRGGGGGGEGGGRTGRGGGWARAASLSEDEGAPGLPPLGACRGNGCRSADGRGVGCVDKRLTGLCAR